MSDISNLLRDPQFFSMLHKQMLQFASLQLNDFHQAEDVVQEALEGAMKNAASFAGRAAWKSWVFTILRNKISDALRMRYRHSNVQLTDDVDEQNFEALFDESGHWPRNEHPQRWHLPDEAVEQEQFWTVFELCLTQLPTQNARAFMMREFIGLETQEICQEMALSVSNLNVMLWRARMRLRECLSQRWFSQEGKYA
ncbi:RNA polymerase subunit sigma [Photorhabdus luminescens]|uniref:RNA polymerase subunit sigma n=3 Tax=Photorhabdus TaxID=29487 RepID=A0A2S8R404_9GAMM|nr:MULTISPECIES: RNA polymerase factor sigma-70 [Photorhabdus]PQQ42286.1 RNA polymerase subunit sigma [Photorhabdus luminescens]EYU14961.1 RNA polymerase sigma-70 factor, TIGR02943 family [Photorhabdus aegyptia]MCC8456435.1 RNA polymerase factor sigma-70 [Photorhabdus aegyptia]PQQ24574.1 RNA polymerase subunit sigma [Photorhabdus hindustanensis]QXF31798.1 RNA polymerase subunit sigma [Photorhabdus akhurstii]